MQTLADNITRFVDCEFASPIWGVDHIPELKFKTELQQQHFDSNSILNHMQIWLRCEIAHYVNYDGDFINFFSVDWQLIDAP